MRVLTIFLLAASAWGCAESSEPQADGPADAAQPNEVSSAGTKPAANPSGASAAWSRQAGGEPPARVHQAEHGAFTLTCDERDGIVIEIDGTTNVPPTEMVRLSTAGASSLYAVRPVQASGRLRATIPASDTMIARLEEGAPIVIAYGDSGEVEIEGGPAVPELVRQCRGSEEAHAAP